MTLTLADARRIIAAGERRALELGQPMNIAVVDHGGNLVSHVRMDGAWVGSVDMSINRAFTARAVERAAVESYAGGGASAPAGAVAQANGLVGALPLVRDGRVVGAVGVSGGTGSQDHAVAEAAVTAF